MKSRLVFVLAILLPVFSSAWSQVYHDAVVEDAYGHVKMIKIGEKVYSYDFDGRLVAVDGEEVSETTEYDDDGYPIRRCGQMCTEYGFEDGFLSMLRYQTLLGEMGVLYEYDSGGERTKKSTVYNLSLLSVDTYRILRYDDKGNWIEREVWHRSVDSKTGELNEGSVEKESRVILYYGASDDGAVLDADFSKYIDRSFPLTMKMMLERPLGVVNTREVSYPTLQAIVATNTDLFSNIRVDKDFLQQPMLLANVQFPYRDYVIDYVALSCVDEQSALVNSIQFHVKVDADNVKSVAKQMCSDLNALGIDMKKRKWDISVGYIGYQGNNTVSIMYSKKNATGVMLLVTFDKRLK